MTTAVVDRSAPSKILNIALWAAQLLLAIAFGMAGFLKSTQPIDALAPQMEWVAAVPVWLVRFIGASELAGAAGLVLPALTRIKPALTPLAAAGLLAVMVLASLFHVTRGELGALPVNAVLGGIAAFIAWGRHSKIPIRSRS